MSGERIVLRIVNEPSAKIGKHILRVGY
jgi:hypothetical protein